MGGFDSRLASARSILWVSVLLFLWGQVLPWKTVHVHPERVELSWRFWLEVGGALMAAIEGIAKGNAPKFPEIVLGFSLIGVVGLLLGAPLLAESFTRSVPLKVLSALLALAIIAVLILVTARPTTALTMGAGFWLIVAAYVVNFIGLMAIPHHRYRD